MRAGPNDAPPEARMALNLRARAVDKPWGRTDLPEPFLNPDGRKIGEVWFEERRNPALPLLVKYIFTSERLSIQVHPGDVDASLHGLASGKEECWYIVDCEPGAVLGIGLTRRIAETGMRAAIADGSIEQLIDWKPIEPGDFVFIPAGTVHAIGAGITLVEIQQNADVTYRLYDYGRPRELHLEHGLSVSSLAPYGRAPIHLTIGDTRPLLAPGDAPFSLEFRSWTVGESSLLAPDGLCWFVPVAGSGSINGEGFQRGECWLVDERSEIMGDAAGSALIAGIGPDAPVSASPGSPSNTRAAT